MSKQYRWLPHPVILFIFSALALATTFFLCVFWYIEAKSGLEEMIARLSLDPFLILRSKTWAMIAFFSLIGGIILASIFLVLVYYQKALQLYSYQQSFINNFTHELKTPVTSLKLYLETFLKYDLSRNDQHKYLQYMLSDVKRLAENINGILNLARLENNEYKGQFSPKNPVQATQNFLRSNNHLFQKAEIHIRNQLTTPVFPKIDIFLYEMLLMNILTNALKYNNKEQCQVDIIFTKSKNLLFIHFVDNGIGLQNKEEFVVFKKFYQSNNSKKLASGGSGLGLYLVSIIAKLHGGKITATSKGKNKGCTFSLVLPLLQR